jgi:hypothetical protein
MFGGKKFVNLNKHEIVLQVKEGEFVSFPPSGITCGAAVKQVEKYSIGGVPVMGNEYGEVQGVPEPEEDTIYIVNMIVLSRMNRSDLVSPDTGPTAIREGGQVKAVIRFVGC